MATQQGIHLVKVGEALEIVDSIPRPVPGPREILVKSLYIALNPVEVWMAKYGGMLTEMPAILGSDFTGRVVQAGSEVTKFDTGDYVFGLCRLGQVKYSPFQETFLVDEDAAFRLPGTVSAAAAATMGTAVLTSALGIFDGGGVKLPEPGTAAAEKDEWIIILGGNGTVGQLGIQLARLSGYKVAASCSASNAELVTGFGAAATFNNRASAEEQANEVEKITGGRFHLVLDATSHGAEAAFAMLKKSTIDNKVFSTVDDMTELDAPDSVTVYRIRAGFIGREGADGDHVTAQVAKMVPLLEGHMGQGKITPVDYEVFEAVGFQALLDAMTLFESGGAKKKLVVQLQQD